MRPQWRSGPGQHPSRNLTPEQGPSPTSKPSPLSTFINKVLLAHSHTHWLTSCSGLPSPRSRELYGCKAWDTDRRALHVECAAGLKQGPPVLQRSQTRSRCGRTLILSSSPPATGARLPGLEPPLCHLLVLWPRAAPGPRRPGVLTCEPNASRAAHRGHAGWMRTLSTTPAFAVVTSSPHGKGCPPRPWEALAITCHPGGHRAPAPALSLASWLSTDLKGPAVQWKHRQSRGWVPSSSRHKPLFPSIAAFVETTHWGRSAPSWAQASSRHRSVVPFPESSCPHPPCEPSGALSPPGPQGDSGDAAALVWAAPCSLQSD